MRYIRYYRRAKPNTKEEEYLNKYFKEEWD